MVAFVINNNSTSKTHNNSNSSSNSNSNVTNGPIKRLYDMPGPILRVFKDEFIWFLKQREEGSTIINAILQISKLQHRKVKVTWPVSGRPQIQTQTVWPRSPILTTMYPAHSSLCACIYLFCKNLTHLKKKILHCYVISMKSGVRYSSSNFVHIKSYYKII